MEPGEGPASRFGCFPVYYPFDTQLPPQPPERSPGQPDEAPGTGESLRGAPAEVWLLGPEGGPGEPAGPGLPAGPLTPRSPHPPLTRGPSAIGTARHPVLKRQGMKGA